MLARALGLVDAEFLLAELFAADDWLAADFVGFDCGAVGEHLLPERLADPTFSIIRALCTSIDNLLITSFVYKIIWGGRQILWRKYIQIIRRAINRQLRQRRLRQRQLHLLCALSAVRVVVASSGTGFGGVLAELGDGVAFHLGYLYGRIINPKRIAPRPRLRLAYPLICQL